MIYERGHEAIAVRNDVLQAHRKRALRRSYFPLGKLGVEVDEHINRVSDDFMHSLQVGDATADLLFLGELKTLIHSDYYLNDLQVTFFRQ